MYTPLRQDQLKIFKDRLERIGIDVPRASTPLVANKTGRLPSRNPVSGRSRLRTQERLALIETCSEALADAPGLHWTHISLIGRGQRSARLETVEQLAVAQRVQPSELMPDVRSRLRR